jgi:hypothetical protein
MLIEPLIMTKVCTSMISQKNVRDTQTTALIARNNDSRWTKRMPYDIRCHKVFGEYSFEQTFLIMETATG